jgi:Gas vesicle synthesis protein GvpL/GvpF
MPADRLTELLSALAREDAPELVRETRAAGRAAAARILEERWRDAYLQAAAEPPRTAAEGHAWWVYGVIAADAVGALPAGLEGIAPGTTVEAIVEGELAAIVSPVPLAEFGDDQLRAHLEDLAWVERVARAHAGVLQALLDGRSVVPLRLCTISMTRERVAALVDEQSDSFTRALTELRGRSEWGVKVFAPTPEASVAEAPADDPHAYLDRKRHARTKRERAHQEAAACAQRVHDAASALAVASVANAPQQREAHGRDADMVLNGAYLVDDERRDELASVIEQLQREIEPFAVELTGPWPAYNFAAPEAGALR